MCISYSQFGVTKLITSFCYDCYYCPVLWNEMKCAGWWKSHFILEVTCLNIECQMSVPDCMLRCCFLLVQQQNTYCQRSHTKQCTSMLLYVLINKLFSSTAQYKLICVNHHLGKLLYYNFLILDIFLRTETDSKILSTHYWIFRFCKKQLVISLAEQVVVSQKDSFSCSRLVIWLSVNCSDCVSVKHRHARFVFITMVLLKIQVLYHITPFEVVNYYRCLERL